MEFSSYTLEIRELWVREEKKKHIDLKTSDNFHVKGEYSGEYY